MNVVKYFLENNRSKYFMKRLDNLLVNSGYGSRREVQKLIRQKKVTVNGEVVNKPAVHVDFVKDKVCVLGEEVLYNEFVYLMMNKPSGFISATYDKFERTVLELVDDEDKMLEPYPIGRLDKDTVGLLIISNDGDMCHRVLSPKRHVEKKYFVRVDGCLNDSYIEIFNDGIVLEDDVKCKPARLTILKAYENESECELILTEGKFHQIKRMFEVLGFKVTYLRRVEFGGIKLDESLKEGEYRHLTSEEVNLLKTV